MSDGLRSGQVATAAGVNLQTRRCYESEGGGQGAGRERRRIVPTGLTGLAGAACLACCLIPLLLAAGVLGGAGWTAAGRVTPGIALALVAVAGLAWWRLARRPRAGECATGGAGGASCSCDDHAGANGGAVEPAQEISVRS